MKIVCLSDTHGMHRLVRQLPDGDVLVHAGDCTGHGRLDQAQVFIDWFATFPHSHKIFCAGNHDKIFEQGGISRMRLPDNMHYLQDSGIAIEGVKFWGSPMQPEFYQWSFNRQRGAQIATHWALIPDDTQVLITHGPAHGHLDAVVRSEGIIPQGCEELRKTIDTRLKNLQAHIFGHLHYQGGQHYVKNGVIYVNAALVDERYALTRQAQVIEIPGSPGGLR
jgi:Icc-related predicted phosphoesterase